MVCSGLVCDSLVWSGLVWSGLVWSGLVCSSPDMNAYIISLLSILGRSCHILSNLSYSISTIIISYPVPSCSISWALKWEMWVWGGGGLALRERKEGRERGEERGEGEGRRGRKGENGGRVEGEEGR